jgi:hypothetical protein
MNARKAKPVLLLLGIVTAALLLTLAMRPARISMPGLVLWAWERPEDLRFINAATTGVAFLAATIDLQADGTPRSHFRQQPLRFPKDAAVIAVVRIESPPRYVLPDPEPIASSIAQIARQQGLRGLQIDYDARASERGFYRDLLARVRRRAQVPIGITALASWCDGDPWIEGQVLSDAVPMFFRMGPGESKDMPIRASGCRGSIGLSTDEAWPSGRPLGLSREARIYLFNPHPWTKVAYDAVLRRVQEWR